MTEEDCIWVHRCCKCRSRGTGWTQCSWLYHNHQTSLKFWSRTPSWCARKFHLTLLSGSKHIQLAPLSRSNHPLADYQPALGESMCYNLQHVKFWTYLVRAAQHFCRRISHFNELFPQSAATFTGTEKWKCLFWVILRIQVHFHEVVNVSLLKHKIVVHLLATMPVPYTSIMK